MTHRDDSIDGLCPFCKQPPMCTNVGYDTYGTCGPCGTYWFISHGYGVRTTGADAKDAAEELGRLTEVEPAFCECPDCRAAAAQRQRDAAEDVPF